jgi:hypothetical protein
MKKPYPTECAGDAENKRFICDVLAADNVYVGAIPPYGPEAYIRVSTLIWTLHHIGPNAFLVIFP